MKEFFDKKERLICILSIVLYVVLESYFIQNFGFTSYISFIANTIFSIVLLLLIYSSKREEYYGLKKPNNVKGFLYFLPLLVIGTVNIWTGISLNASANDILFHILTMINAGFIEEILFRGFLFKLLEKKNIKMAIIISSLTFGLGHIVNMFNGADLIPTLVQVLYAVAIGYLFVIIFIKSKSLLPCIFTHMLFNSLSIVNVDIDSTFTNYIIPLILIIVVLLYAYYINKQVKD